MAAELPEVLADPVGVVVGLVTGVDPALEPAAVAGVVAAVAGGRAKRRRLAQALAERPALLADGRSPAPRVAGDLLVALRKAGAGVSPPCCAGCGKHLRTFQRRGQDWYCTACGPTPLACAACGNLRPVACRDRQGQPRCAQCPPPGDQDPTQAVVEIVGAVDPALPADVVAAAVAAAAPRAGQRRQLAWALADRPDLLTGAGARAPVPSVLRLIDGLCEAGSARITRPACPRCARVVRLPKQHAGTRICRTCDSHLHAEPCARCGALRQPATRDRDGRPVCPNCLLADPANLETCTHCGRLRRVDTRTPHGPLCPSCPPLPTLTCSICGTSAPCGISRLTGRPWCWACQRRSARCTSCGQVEPVRSGSLAEPRCEACTTPEFRPDCPTCAGRPRAGQCPRCRLDHRLREVLAGPDGTTHPALRPLHQALAATEPPGTALRWLAHAPVAAFLAEVAAGRQLTHAELDSLPPSPTLAHLRSVLVATGTLPPRDEHMARLERLLHDLLATRTDPDQRHLLHRYAVWHLVRRLRRRNNGTDTTHEQLAVVRQHVRAAIVVLDWLDTRQLTLATCRQADLEHWLASGDATHRQEAGHFIRWAHRQHLTSLVFPATRWQGPTRALDEQARWDAARRLLHDDTLPPRDRLAGLLVLLYAQNTTTISRLTTSHVDTADGTVRLRLGPTPITLPTPLADLALHLMTEERGHATTGAAGPSPWLFPGGQPGRPISAGHLGQRLKALGIHPGQARSTALFHLATELPAAVLARMLGIHIDVAAAWQRACAGDWATYAADVSRRTAPAEPAGHQAPRATHGQRQREDVTTGRRG